MPFLNEQPNQPFDITAEWLLARTESGTRRCWFSRNRKYFYSTAKKTDDTVLRNGQWVFEPEKYRVLKIYPDWFMLRIVKVESVVAPEYVAKL